MVLAAVEVTACSIPVKHVSDKPGGDSAVEIWCNSELHSVLRLEYTCRMKGARPCDDRCGITSNRIY